MKQSFALLLCFTLGTIYFAHGQDDLKPSVIPPSPDAAALGKYGDVQMGTYTGSPSISIPLYQITQNDINVPISLSYDATGVKVNQVASWVGLNWTLNCGGVVTRAVRGLYDDNAAFSYKSLSQQTLDQLSTSSMIYGANMTAAKNISLNRNQDAEPDIYYYNFNGHSGKFIETADGIFTLDREDIKIEKVGGWLITDERGVKFSFGVGEDTKPNNYKSISDFTSSWYLRYIEAPNGKRINFFYKSVGKERTPILRSKSYDVEYNYFGFPSSIGNYRNNDSYSYILVRKVLDSIQFDGGCVKFHSVTDRLDYQTSDQLGTYSPGTRLSKIELRDANNIGYKTFNFGYGYFHNGSTSFENYRLRLDMVSESDDLSGLDAAEDDKLFRFEYYDGRLPSIISESQDHWGYYTGRGNSLLPSYDLANYKVNAYQREPSQEAMVNGTLKRLYYPTGGYNEFIYESHDYGFVAEVALNEQVIVPLSWNVHARKPENPTASQYSTAYSNVINIDNTILECKLDVDFQYTMLPQAKEMQVQIIKVTFPVGTPESQMIPANMTSSQIVSSFLGNNDVVDHLLLLAPGYYFVKAFTNVNGTYAYATFTANKDGGITKVKKAGGLRVGKIKTVDPIGKTSMTKRYTYVDEADPTRSSGVLVSAPVYEVERITKTGLLANPTSGARYANMKTGCETVVVKKWKEVRSSSAISLGATHGSHIGYNRVITESLDENGISLGKTIEYFSNAAQFTDNATIFPSSPGTNKDIFRGKLLRQRIEGADGQLLQETVNKYDYNIHKSYRALMLNSNYDLLSAADTVHICAFDKAAYSLNIASALLKRSTTTRKQPLDNSILVEKTSYYYDKKDITPWERSHIQPTKTIQWLSNGDSLAVLQTYSIDYPTDTVLVKMFNVHNIYAPVEQQKVLQTTQQLIYGRKSSYATFYNVQRARKVEEKYHGAAPYLPSVELLSYDQEGRLIRWKDRSGMEESYLWNTTLSIPVAKISNTLPSNCHVNDFEDIMGTSTTGDAHSGLKSRLTSYSKSLSGLANGNYKLSYWIKQSGTWNLIQQLVTVSAGTYAINITGQIDDLRFAPENTQLTTYTYSAKKQLVASIDPNLICFYFEYDTHGRLKLTHDENKNILKSFDYNFSPYVAE